MQAIKTQIAAYKHITVIYTQYLLHMAMRLIIHNITDFFASYNKITRMKFLL